MTDFYKVKRYGYKKSNHAQNLKFFLESEPFLVLYWFDVIFVNFCRCKPLMKLFRSLCKKCRCQQ